MYLQRRYDPFAFAEAVYPASEATIRGDNTWCLNLTD